MKLNRRILCVLLVLVMFIASTSLLFSAGESEDAGDESVVLSFIGYFTNENPENAEAPAIAYHESKARFLAANPTVTIDEEILAHDAYETKMMTLAASGDVPDFFQLKAVWIPNFIDNDLIEPLDDRFISDKEWFDNFYTGTFNDFTYEGDVYGIPYQNATVSNLLYNKGIFNECGITEFPTSSEEFIQAIGILKDNGYIPMTVGNLGGWFLDVVVFRGILDRFVTPEWKMSISNGTGAKLNDPEFIEALSELKAWSDLGAFNDDINSIDYVQMRSHYYNRKAAMMMDGSGGMKPISDAAPEEILAETVVTILPPFGNGTPNGNPATAGWSFGYAKGLSDEKMDVIVPLLKTLSDKENSKVIIENNGFSASAPNAYDESKLSDLTNKYNTMVNSAVMTPLTSIPAAVIPVLYSGLQELIIDQITPEALAEKLQKALEEE